MIKFFVENFKVWSDRGDVAQFNSYDEVLDYIEEVSNGSDWEMYRYTLDKKFEPVFELTLNQNALKK